MFIVAEKTGNVNIYRLSFEYHMFIVVLSTKYLEYCDCLENLFELHMGL